MKTLALVWLSTILFSLGAISSNKVEFSKEIPYSNNQKGTKIYDNKSVWVGSIEIQESGIIKYFDNKKNYLGCARKRPNGTVSIYDKNSKKIGEIKNAGKDWINNIFWDFFYQ